MANETLGVILCRFLPWPATRQDEYRAETIRLRDRRHRKERRLAELAAEEEAQKQLARIHACGRTRRHGTTPMGGDPTPDEVTP